MRKVFFLLLLVVMAVLTAHADVIPDMKFRRLDTRHGLSHSQVNCIFRDSRGFVWFGTAYGLNRYDGYRVKTFYSNVRDTTTMRDNFTDRIQEAWDGKLWMKQNMNYSIYDPKTELFERNATRQLSRIGIVGGLEYVFIDKQKHFWIKIYEKGFYYYNPSGRSMTNVRLGYGKGEFNPTYGMSSAVDYGDKMLMVTFNGELVCLDGKAGRSCGRTSGYANTADRRTRTTACIAMPTAPSGSLPVVIYIYMYPRRSGGMLRWPS